MLDFAAAKSVRPMVETMPLCDVNKAMRRLLEGDAHYRIVLLSPGVEEEDEEKEERESAGGEREGAAGATVATIESDTSFL